ncbi:peptidylprolyl isomerase [Pontibacter qinzhouensis]|uniref:peptidylprolyl isomerase n=1 Tax=Pontibacter qinzhouensis TaxID=2603253 RepID=A0A5C8JI33_9BACT|nr:peptidylprolyl isomerase [Pontibacter qinzhouensis]TXK37990.1 peptidylprolyl isomerase [Pontibacter qinzhouensis]
MTTPLSAVKAAVLLFFVCITSACNSGQDKTEVQTEAQPTPDEQLQATTSDNVVEVLTAYGKENPDTLALISTRHGDIKVRLYKDTPLHRANFVRLVKLGFYDQGEFYRVLEGFAIQGGDSDNRTMKQGVYKIPQEFNPAYYHKRGALAMARYGDERNPEKESSSHNFYIVQGKPKAKHELQAFEQQKSIAYTPEQTGKYLTEGGAPSLDQEFTVFGEVIEGFDVIDKIAAEPVNSQKWPKAVVPHTIKILN